MLIIGIPNGSLYDATIALLKKINVQLESDGRKFLTNVSGIGFFNQAIIMRPQDIPEAVFDGMIDFGICGWDCVAESGMIGQVEKICELHYGKKTRQAVRIVLYGKKDTYEDREGVLLATEYPNLTHPLCARATMRFSHGGTEQKVAYGKYDYGVSVTESGDSITKNGLRIIREILISPTVLIAREKTEDLFCFGDLLKGALEAERFQLLKLNVPKDRKQAVLDILPALQSPTINRRADGGFAIETTVPSENLAELMINLRRLGATGIIAQDTKILIN